MKWAGAKTFWIRDAEVRAVALVNSATLIVEDVVITDIRGRGMYEPEARQHVQQFVGKTLREWEGAI